MGSTVLAAAIGSGLALVGFAGAANASAAIDLIWIQACPYAGISGAPIICLLSKQRNCLVDQRAVGVPGFPDGVALDSEAFSDPFGCFNYDDSHEFTLVAILTAGSNGSWGADVSVNYGDALPQVSVLEFQSLTTTVPFHYLPLSPGTTTNQPPYIDHINALADPPDSFGIGLPPGGTAWLGTVMFHKDLIANGMYEISVGTDGPGDTDGVLDGFGNDITATTTFNSAYLVNGAVVVIDIKPGSDSNPIHPSGRGNLPVAILGSESFDAMNVDVTTLTFGPGAAAPSHDLTKPGAFADHLRDVNADGFTDLVSHYRTQETDISRDDAEACITGDLLDSTPFEGCDAITVVTGRSPRSRH
jgi:hypothetical protein